MLLPHGYEGQGPEHSSARLERYLQGCAENNVTVANLTSASNFFHLLRRQLARPFRKPLIVMTPKSTLRPPFNTGLISEIEAGTRFQEILDDVEADPKKVKRLLVCSGKIYYDLLKRRQETGRNDVAIVRLEQMYPFPTTQFEAVLAKYKGADRPIWVQEEPANMGAWGYLLMNQHQYDWKLSARPSAASGAWGYLLMNQHQYDWKLSARPSAASPATGFPKVHEKQQIAVVDAAFEG